MGQDFKTAREVSEHLLEKTGRALMNGDFDEFLRHFRLPQFIYTFEGQRYIETPAELFMIFSAVRRHMRRNDVTDMVRHCVEAEFRNDTCVHATHETRFISGTTITQSPFAVFSVLEFDGAVWQVTSSHYAIADRPDHNAALLCAGTEGPKEERPATS